MPDLVHFSSIKDFESAWACGLFGDFGFRDPAAFASKLIDAGHTQDGDGANICLQGAKRKTNNDLLEAYLSGVYAEYAASSLAEFPQQRLQITLIDASRFTGDIGHQKTDNIKITNPAHYSNDMDCDGNRDTYLGTITENGKTYYLTLENE
jgi:hypothetical protein